MAPIVVFEWYLIDECLPVYNGYVRKRDGIAPRQWLTAQLSLGHYCNVTEGSRLQLSMRWRTISIVGVVGSWGTGQ
jgi:hypothetical protein